MHNKKKAHLAFPNSQSSKSREDHRQHKTVTKSMHETNSNPKSKAWHHLSSSPVASKSMHNLVFPDSQSSKSREDHRQHKTVTKIHACNKLKP
jgi:hypothetical protein